MILFWLIRGAQHVSNAFKQVKLHKLALGEHVGTSYVDNALGTLHEVYDGVRVVIRHLHHRGVLKWHLEDSRRLLSKHIYKAWIDSSAQSKRRNEWDRD